MLAPGFPACVVPVVMYRESDVPARVARRYTFDPLTVRPPMKLLPVTALYVTLPSS